MSSRRSRTYLDLVSKLPTHGAHSFVSDDGLLLEAQEDGDVGEDLLSCEKVVLNLMHMYKACTY